MVRGEGSGVVRMFWDAFRLNLKQAVLIFLILLIPVLLVVYEFWMYLSGAVGQSMWLGLVFCCPSLILALVLAYVYPLLAQFDNSIKNTLKNACLLAIGSLPYSLVMAALNLLPVALFLFATSFFFRTAIFWVLIGGALVAVCMLTRLSLILPIIALAMLASSVSDIIQVGYFKYTKKKTGTGKRVFRMAPLHHHFELGGMPETRIVAMYMIVTTILCLLTLTMFA